MTTSAPPGWRTDPGRTDQERWWTGQGWSEHVRPLGPVDFTWVAPASGRQVPRRQVPGRPTPRRPGRRLLVTRVLVGGAVLLLLVIAAASGGPGGPLVVLALIGGVVGLVSLVRGRSATFRVRGRGAAAVVLVGSTIAFVAGGAALGATGPVSQEAPVASQTAGGAPAAATAVATPTGSASATAAATGAPTATPGTEPVPGSALAVLATLPVKGRAPMTGYARTADFGAAWLDVDRNGCDTRNDVLRRDLTAATESRCLVRSGVLADPYTGRTIDFLRGEGTSQEVQIDHVVALADAWRTGAQQLTAARRVALANDPINLFAVDGPTNEQKSDGDAATWLPPNKPFRCTYVAHQVGVKRAYGLWVTPAEHAAMERILSACPTIVSPTSTVSHAAMPPGALPSGAIQSSPRPTATAAPGSSAVDPRYAYCSVAKEHGAHTPYFRGSDPEYAWYTDRDGDGIVCE